MTNLQCYSSNFDLNNFVCAAVKKVLSMVRILNSPVKISINLHIVNKHINYFNMQYVYIYIFQSWLYPKLFKTHSFGGVRMYTHTKHKHTDSHTKVISRNQARTWFKNRI